MHGQLLFGACHQFDLRGLQGKVAGGNGGDQEARPGLDRPAGLGLLQIQSAVAFDSVSALIVRFYGVSQNMVVCPAYG